MVWCAPRLYLFPRQWSSMMTTHRCVWSQPFSANKLREMSYDRFTRWWQQLLTVATCLMMGCVAILDFNLFPFVDSYFKRYFFCVSQVWFSSFDVLLKIRWRKTKTRQFDTLWNEMHTMCICIRFITEGPDRVIVIRKHSFIHSQLINPSSNRLIRRKKRKTTSIYLLFARIRSPILYPVFLSHRQTLFDLLPFQVSKQQRPPIPRKATDGTPHLSSLTWHAPTTLLLSLISFYCIK